METFSVLQSICAGKSPVTGEFPAQRPATRSSDIFFDMCLNKRLSKKSRCWWFEMLSRPLGRHCKDISILQTRGIKQSNKRHTRVNIRSWNLVGKLRELAMVMTDTFEISHKILNPPRNRYFTDFGYYVWFTISLNCDVKQLSETDPRGAVVI